MSIKLPTHQHRKRRVGIYLFTSEKRLRGETIDQSFDKQKFFGFKYIIDEIDQNENDVRYVSFKEVNNCDVVLISLTSSVEYPLLVKELYNVGTINSTVIVGGAGVTNIHFIKPYIDVAVFRRGEGIINDLLNGNYNFPNVWSKKDDPQLENKYHIGKLKTFLPIRGTHEKGIGCNQMCYYCDYCWANYYVRDPEHTGTYSSGFDGEKETTIKDMIWDKTENTAVDGVTEYTRNLINKPILDSDITEQFKTLYTFPTDKAYSLHLYAIIGYPWEGPNIVEYNDLVLAIQKADNKKHTHKASVILKANHFIPMLYTPMFFESFNWNNYRRRVNNMYSFNKNIVYQGSNITLYSGMYTTSPNYASQQLIFQRARPEDTQLLHRVFLSPTYINARVTQKLKLLKKYIPDYYFRELEIDEPMSADYIDPPYNFRKIAKKYKKKRDTYLQEQKI